MGIETGWNVYWIFGSVICAGILLWYLLKNEENDVHTDTAAAKIHVYDVFSLDRAHNYYQGKENRICKANNSEAFMVIVGNLEGKHDNDRIKNKFGVGLHAK